MFGVVPKPLWEKRAPADDRNRIRWGCGRCSCEARRTMIIDAGIGDKMDAKSVDIYAIDRPSNLDHSLAAGLIAGDIDIVLASHLHFDHAGGFTRVGDEALSCRAFRARYVVRTRRVGGRDASARAEPRELPRENFVPLADAGVLDFVSDGRGDHAGRSRRAHRRPHDAPSGRLDRVGGETAVFAADLIPTTAHIDEPWIMGYDLYPMDTLAFKRAFVREAIDREYLIFFEHDPASPPATSAKRTGASRRAVT